MPRALLALLAVLLSLSGVVSDYAGAMADDPAAACSQPCDHDCGDQPSACADPFACRALCPTILVADVVVTRQLAVKAELPAIWFSRLQSMSRGPPPPPPRGDVA